MQPTCLDVSQIIGPGIGQSLPFLSRRFAVIGFPLPDDLLRTLPITKFQRFTHLLAAEQSVDPYRTLALPVFPSLCAVLARFAMPAIDGQHRGTLLPDAELRRQPMMNPFKHRTRNSQRNIPSLMAGTSFSEYKNSGLLFEKFANFISTQVPHFGDFRNGVVSLGVRRGLELE
ncbi:MAG TPA: hypothetical protein VFN26_22390 [Candidatus Acidoferrum sp.]|nr:hypothetical protein [Candidatus Acidoferrum sp.]